MGPKVSEEEYIDFLVASPKAYSCVEASRVHPEQGAVSHDALTRLLHRVEPSAQALWEEVRTEVEPQGGYLVLDDSTLDKPYARKMELVTHHWSGKHHRVVKGINLVTLLWTDGDRHLPCDYRVYHKDQDGLSKNDHFASMVDTAASRGFRPRCVCFDSWYASTDNLKRIDRLRWRWLTRLKGNRQVNPDKRGNVPVDSLEVPESGRVVHLKGYGFIRVFRTVAQHGRAEHWATNYLEMSELERLQAAEASWRIEQYHQGIKQNCGVERCQARSARAQRNHIGMAIRAFCRFERYCFHTGVSWFEAKQRIIRDAVRQYLQNPAYSLP